MSHISRIKTQMVDKSFLTQALTDLGYTWEEGEVTILRVGTRTRQSRDQGQDGFFSADIGFTRAGEAYDMIADWSGVRSTNASSSRTSYCSATPTTPPAPSSRPRASTW